jgi:hypothetical protein
MRPRDAEPTSAGCARTAIVIAAWAHRAPPSLGRNSVRLALQDRADQQV